MNIAPVDIFTGLQGMTVTRSGGFTGAVEQVTVDPQLRATLTNSRAAANPRHFTLDPREAELLIHAVTAAVQSGVAPRGPLGNDMYQYDIELEYGGHTYRIPASTLAADEALHGIIGGAIDGLFDPHAGMTVQPMPHTGEPDATNGNSGVVPPWLR